MKLSDLHKNEVCNQDVVCSGNKLCPECKTYRKENKRANNKGVRKLNKKYTLECMNDFSTV